MNSDDERLITHHATRKLLELKAKTFPRIAFLLDLFLYIMFTLLCTIYHLISNEKIIYLPDEALGHNHMAGNESHVIKPIVKEIFKLRQLDLEVHVSVVFFIYISLFTVVCIHLSKEFFQMISYNLVNYLSSVDNWFQLTALFITILSLVPGMPHQVQIAIGSFSILFAWICMSLFFQDLELFSLGRYIVAFRKTIQNSFKFMPFFVMICLGFFFSFKVGERMNLDTSKNLTANGFAYVFFTFIAFTFV